MSALRLLFALVLTAAAPSFAVAQDATPDQSQSTDQLQDPSFDPSETNGGDPIPALDNAAPADPVEALQGLWHVDRAEGSAANDAMTGGILKIDRQAIASLTGGTCSSPEFATQPNESEAAGSHANGHSVDIICLGQTLAWTSWNSDDPDTVQWNEPNLQVILHRVSTATTPKPADDGSDGDAQ